jgi:hypothetical protein
MPAPSPWPAARAGRPDPPIPRTPGLCLRGGGVRTPGGDRETARAGARARSGRGPPISVRPSGSPTSTLRTATRRRDRRPTTRRGHRPAAGDTRALGRSPLAATGDESGTRPIRDGASHRAARSASTARSTTGRSASSLTTRGQRGVAGRRLGVRRGPAGRGGHDLVAWAAYRLGRLEDAAAAMALARATGADDARLRFRQRHRARAW